MNSTIKAHLALIIVAMLYGGNYIVAKDVMKSGAISPEGFIMIRILCAGSLFWAIHPFMAKEQMDKKDILYAAICALFGITINQLCFFKGLSLTSPMHASLIMITTPIMVLIGSFFVLKNKIVLRQIIGISLGLIGAIILVSNAGVNDNISSLKGDLLIMTNAASYALYLLFTCSLLALYLLLVKKLMEKYHEFTVFKWIFLFGGLYAAPFGLPGLLDADWDTLVSNHWIAVSYVILGATFLAYLLNGYALGRIRPSTVSFYIYFQPLIATSISIGIGQDSLDIYKVMAAAFLFVGVYFVIQNKVKKT